MSASPQETGVMPVEVQASGVPPTAGQLVVEHPSRGRRVREAGLMVLGGALLAVVLLPVPIIHLVGVGLFLTILVLAVRRVRAPAVIRSAHGTCPKCGAEGAFFVGFGRKQLRLPISTSCGRCAYPLTLARPDQTAPS
jgi:ribosomal protein S27AE